jgi:hypothetical protein
VVKINWLENLDSSHYISILVLHASFSIHMTFDDFKMATRRKNSFDKYWHYGVAISFTLSCLFGIFYVTFIDTGKFRSVAYVLYPGLLLILAMSLSAFYLLPNRYKVVEIISSLSLDDKRKVTNLFISNYCEMPGRTNSNHFVCYVKRRWWQSIYRLHFYYDESRFAFSLQGHDRDGGWIDFGETERKRRKITVAIKNLINQ